MALTFAAYAAPAGWEKPVAVAAVARPGRGELPRRDPHRRADPGHRRRRPARRWRVVVAAGLGRRCRRRDAAWATARSWPHGWYGILQSAGLLFFAFAGYARIATMGEEVRDPARTIPRAILTRAAHHGRVYAAVAVTVAAGARPGRLAGRAAPLVDAVDAGRLGLGGPDRPGRGGARPRSAPCWR